jgi:hypothetical protein
MTLKSTQVAQAKALKPQTIELAVITCKLKRLVGQLDQICKHNA